MNDKTLDSNAVQFARLLSEINATQDIDMELIAEAMDLSAEQVENLFESAYWVWEDAKKGT